MQNRKGNLTNSGPRLMTDEELTLFLKSAKKCLTCNDTKEVENPLTGEVHFCPFVVKLGCIKFNQYFRLSVCI